MIGSGHLDILRGGDVIRHIPPDNHEVGDLALLHAAVVPVLAPGPALSSP
jgi:hypothetical protein